MSEKLKPKKSRAEELEEAKDRAKYIARKLISASRETVSGVLGDNSDKKSKVVTYEDDLGDSPYIDTTTTQEVSLKQDPLLTEYIDEFMNTKNDETKIKKKRDGRRYKLRTELRSDQRYYPQRISFETRDSVDNELTVRPLLRRKEVISSNKIQSDRHGRGIATEEVLHSGDTRVKREVEVGADGLIEVKQTTERPGSDPVVKKWVSRPSSIAKGEGLKSARVAQKIAEAVVSRSLGLTEQSGDLSGKGGGSHDRMSRSVDGDTLIARRAKRFKQIEKAKKESERLKKRGVNMHHTRSDHVGW